MKQQQDESDEEDMENMFKGFKEELNQLDQGKATAGADDTLDLGDDLGDELIGVKEKSSIVKSPAEGILSEIKRFSKDQSSQSNKRSPQLLKKSLSDSHLNFNEESKIGSNHVQDFTQNMDIEANFNEKKPI